VGRHLGPPRGLDRLLHGEGAVAGAVAVAVLEAQVYSVEVVVVVLLLLVGQALMVEVAVLPELLERFQVVEAEVVMAQLMGMGLPGK